MRGRVAEFTEDRSLDQDLVLSSNCVQINSQLMKLTAHDSESLCQWGLWLHIIIRTCLFELCVKFIGNIFYYFLVYLDCNKYSWVKRDYHPKTTRGGWSFYTGALGKKANRPQLFRCLDLWCSMQRVSRSYKGHRISEKFDTNEEVKWNLL